MPGFVRTAEDEALWEWAKRVARKMGFKGARMYRYANAVFQRRRGRLARAAARKAEGGEE